MATPISSETSFIIISPMRNEAATVRTTLAAIVQQTALPAAWIIFDDGSTDASGKYVDEYAAKYPWIKRIQLEDRGFDFTGQGVAQVLNLALKAVADLPSEFICKLDVDLDLPVDYFECILKRMTADPLLGICSGHPYVLENHKKLLERHSDYFPSGTARMYRRKFLDEIGQYVESVGWDTVDILRMRMRGYRTQAFHEIQYHHIRRMGTRKSYLDGMTRDGRNAYLTGYCPFFFTLRALFNMKYRPYLIRGMAMLWGYFKAYTTGLQRVVTPPELAYHRKLQRRRLLFRNIN